MDYYNIDYEALKKSVASLNADYAHGKALIVRDSLNYQALPSLEGPRNTILGFLLKLENTPDFNFLLSIALYATWIPLILSFITTRKRDVSLAALAPMYASMAVLFTHRDVPLCAPSVRPHTACFRHRIKRDEARRNSKGAKRPMREEG